MNLTKIIKREILITSLTVIGIAITFFGLTYAIYFTIDEKNIGTVSFGQLSFDMCMDESCSSGGTTYGTTLTGDVYPMNTTEGTSQTPYLFKVTNNATDVMYTKVYAAKEGLSSDYTNVKLAAKVQGTSTYSYADLTQDASVLIDLQVPAGQTKIIEVYMWLDEEASNEVIGKTVTAFINAIGYIKPDDPNNLHTGDTYIANVSAPLVSGQTLSYTGSYQEFEAPVSGYYFIETWGAQGGDYLANEPAGKGGYSSGYLYLANGEKLYVYVGGQGQEGTGTSNAGGWNGGGYSGTYTTSGYYNGGGGGATDIRYFGNETPSASDLEWDSALGLNSRIMVAGGGGGSGNGTSYNIYGGAGGTLVGGTGLSTSGTFGTSEYQPTGGSQTSGGENAHISGSTGSFGYANQTSLTENVYGGGGGGGYYGGAEGFGSAGSGGSSFISGYAGVNAITSASSRTHTNNTLHYSGKYFLDGTMKSGIREGNGQATIRYVGAMIKTNTKLDGVRYIKDCVNGSSYNANNHWVEVQAIKDGTNIAKNKTVTATSSINSGGAGTINGIADGDIDSAMYVGISGSNQCVTVDLGTTYDLDEIAVWHYYEDTRTYYDNVTYVSSDNSTWTEVINQTIPESIDGKRVSAYEEVVEKVLPNEYQLVEYIQSSGTQYIDTGYYWQNEIIRITFDGTVITNSSAQSLFGNEEYTASSGTTRNFCGIPYGSNGTYAIYLGSSANTPSVTTTLGTRFNLDIRTLPSKNVVVLKSGQQIVNQTYSGTVLSRQNAYLSSSASTTVGHIFIFSNHNSSRGASNAAIQNIDAMRLYSFKLYDNGELVRDFVPCYRKANNEIGLYDLVNGVFYTNKGTGTFSKGSNV